MYLYVLLCTAFRENWKKHEMFTLKKLESLIGLICLSKVLLIN